jgi:nicotinamide phosphoribosyltransferase
MAGYSIPAAEHSTITSWGREREVDAYRNMLRQFGKPGAIVAVVSDSYDIYRAISEHWGTTLRDEVIASGATLVIRPTRATRWRWWPKACAGWMKRSATDQRQGLSRAQPRAGDPGRWHQSGHDPRHPAAHHQRRLRRRQRGLRHGRRLLQRLDRDTQKFALKCSAARVDGEWIDVYKDPVTDAGKTSKRGRMRLLRRLDDGSLHTVPLPANGDDTCRTASRTRW